MREMRLSVEFRDHRLAVFLCVLLFHGILSALLIRASRIRLALDQVTPSFAMELLPELSRVQAGGNRPETVNSGSTSKPANKPRSVVAAEPRIRVDDEPAPGSAITLPLVDWELEAETVARNTTNAKLFRDLAGFTPEQLEWMKRNQMQPVPYNPFWDDGRHVDEPGVLWISDDCAIVNLLPVCRIKLGKRKVRGDLFKDMRKYLDERETDPLP
jgi:hypothetical protein